MRTFNKSFYSGTTSVMHINYLILYSFHLNLCKHKKQMDQFKGQPCFLKFFVPKCYNIRLKINLIAHRFASFAIVNPDIVIATSFIVLNTTKLSVSNDAISFTNQGSSKVIKPSRVKLFENDEIMVLEFTEELPIGFSVLSIRSKVILNDRVKGFYRSTYEHNGEKKSMAVRQFEPIDAKQCIPCWDEAACKATFKITLDVTSELVALSNMPIVEEITDGNLKTVSYQESPIMWSKFECIIKLVRQTKGNFHLM